MVFTRLHILLYTVILIIASLMPFLIGMSGLIYLAGALALGAGFLYWALVLLRNTNPAAPMETFKYSIVYLGVLFVFLLVDHYFLLTLAPAEPAGPVYEWQQITQLLQPVGALLS